MGFRFMEVTALPQSIRISCLDDKCYVVSELCSLLALSIILTSTTWKSQGRFWMKIDLYILFITLLLDSDFFLHFFSIAPHHTRSIDRLTNRPTDQWISHRTNNDIQTVGQSRIFGFGFGVDKVQSVLWPLQSDSVLTFQA